MAHDVFISYSFIDKTVAEAVCNKLEYNRIRCWMAPRDILPGEDWAESIVNAIPVSKIMILIFSSNSNSSEQVFREVSLATESGVIVYPFKIEDIKPTGGMSYYLSTVHWIDACNADLEKNINVIYKRVRKIVKPPKKVEESKTNASENYNLEVLILQNNEIEDISPLSGLTKLRAMNLYGNPIDR